MKRNKKNSMQKQIESKRRIKIIRIILLIMVLVLVTAYYITKVLYETGEFTITLDENLSKKSGLIMYEKSQEKVERKILKSDKINFLDNISIDWLPVGINNESEGGHNGENYIAYTFYVENQGIEDIDYWYKIAIDDVIKNVDEAIRIMVFVNDSKTIFAKANSTTGLNEIGTKAFYSDKYVAVEQRENMKVGDVDKITIVIWVEGDDPDCLDNLIGGEMKMHMDITEEHGDTEKVL